MNGYGAEEVQHTFDLLGLSTPADRCRYTWSQTYGHGKVALLDPPAVEYRTVISNSSDSPSEDRWPSESA